VDYGKAAVFREMNVELNDVDAKVDGGLEGGQGVLRALRRISAMSPQQDTATSKLRGKRVILRAPLPRQLLPQRV